MRYMIVFILTLAIVPLIGCATSQQARNPQSGGEQVTYAVYGMDCPGCHGGVEKNLKKIPGIVDASANWKQKTLTVTLDSGQPLDDAAIEKAVKDSNFTLGEKVK
jgi:copper chaperone CopZ